jgi:sirohydrochlorin cobaltochelatase
MLVLFTHGSRDRRWLEPFEKLEEALKAALGPEAVRLAHLELASPSLMDVAAEAAKKGVAHLRLLPLFMAGGGHVANDIPKLVEEIKARFGNLQVEILPAVGEHPRFAQMIREIALETARNPGPSG